MCRFFLRCPTPILFADLVESTKLYATLGDAEAFRRVRNHFIALQQIVGAHRGSVVKTMGDGLMASFRDPESGLQAAFQMRERFGPGLEHPLALRTSVHHGLCLAVRLDTGLDYFGSAVNFTAKLQQQAEPSEVIFSKAFLDLPKIEANVSRRGVALRPLEFEFP